MSLIECPDCGQKISTNAPHCIHCGNPLKKNNIKTTKNTTTIEQTGKDIKTQIVFSIILFFLSLFLLSIHPSFVLLTIISLIWLIVAKISAWWKHG